MNYDSKERLMPSTLWATHPSANQVSYIQIQNRTFASDSKIDDSNSNSNSKKLPFGLEEILGEPDNQNS